CVVVQLELPPTTGNHCKAVTVLNVREIRHSFNAIFRVHMYATHEPARFISANRQDRHAEGAATFDNADEFRVERRIATEKDRMLTGSQGPAAPQSSIAAAEGPA